MAEDPNILIIEDGDRALIEVANVLKQTFREFDIIARIGRNSTL